MTSGKYFNKGVRARNEYDLGHVMKETNDKIVIFGEGNNRFDVPKSEIYQVGMNVILKIDFPEIFKYSAKLDTPLPTGEPINTIVKEAYPDES